ncbi:MAG: phosphoesterase PA-phosphatase related protein [Gemmatimonadetes bacterium]|nr:phosphoesterase PA-phosphatase related protein [Gemmatimonadota bacterium]
MRSVSSCLGWAFTATLLALGCDKSVLPTELLPPLEPTSLEPTAGTWRMVALTGATQIGVAAPTAVTSAAYLAELDAIKMSQANLTAEQRRAIDYWSGGGVMRWNQILRELVARYNLPPAPKDEGGYPVPDAENPFGDPSFPFANPVYAARAYSYVSTAQYDALKSAWYYKYLYKRLSPAKNGTGISALTPISDIPSYPSEDAVLSGVTADMLKSLFPAAIQEVTLKAAEQRNAAIWSGKATASDVAAGLALGKAVAAAFLTRAGADGMRTAGGSPAQWQALADSATTRGQIAWISQDIPARPPMLPLFGQVRAWTMTPAEIVAERPAPPPATSSRQMKDEVAEVKQVAGHVTREQLAIAQKWNDGAGTYSPPGHWNDIALEYVRDAKMSEVRAARVFALLNMAMHDAAVGCWEAKFYYFNPRPSQMDQTIKTQIGLPNFPSYTSGHSTFSAAAAAVLSDLFPSGASSFSAMRDEAGVSRMYGGIHYRSDIEAGKSHGARIAAHTLAFAHGDGAQ